MNISLVTFLLLFTVLLVCGFLIHILHYVGQEPTEEEVDLAMMGDEHEHD